MYSIVDYYAGYISILVIWCVIVSIMKILLGEPCEDSMSYKSYKHYKCEISYHRNTVGIEYYGNIMEDIEPTIWSYSNHPKDE